MAKSDLEGKIAIVTGAAGGFGRAIVKSFVDHGMRVAAFDIDANRLEALEAEYSKDGVLALTFCITDPAACATNVQKVADHFGGLQPGGQFV